MEAFIVYRVDYVKGKKIPIGTIVERREKKRPENLLGLLKIARKSFSRTPQEAFHVVLEKKALTGP